MTIENKVYTDYYNWLCKLIRTSFSSSYKKLLKTLSKIDFFYMFLEDSNRDADGIELRYRFAYENQLDDALIASYVDIYPCSVLEMMVALCLRCEETIMSDSKFDDRTGFWFWKMIDNLGLKSMTDTVYDEHYVQKAIERFMNRKYDPDGHGGLVVIPNCAFDLTKVEIWYQMMWYLNLFTAD